MVDNDNRDVCGLSAIDPLPNCRIAPALPYSQGCPAGTVVGWLVPMVESRIQPWVRAERSYRLLFCPGSPVAVAAAVEQLGAALASQAASAACSKNEQLCGHCISSSSSSNSSSSSYRNSRAEAAAISSEASAKRGHPAEAATTTADKRATYTVIYHYKN